VNNLILKENFKVNIKITTTSSSLGRGASSYVALEAGLPEYDYVK